VIRMLATQFNHIATSSLQKNGPLRRCVHESFDEERQLNNYRYNARMTT